MRDCNICLYFMDVSLRGWNNTAVQSQKAVSAYFTSKQIPPFDFAEKSAPYCGFGEIFEILIFTRRTNSRIQESHENY